MRTIAALALLAASACGGDEPEIEATLRFADRTDAEIERLINAATCTDMAMLVSRINQFGDKIVEDRCPSITVGGDHVATITGGCTTLDGVQVHGSATVTNPVGWDHIEAYDNSVDTVYTANQLVIIDEDGARTFDGVVRHDHGRRSLDADITVTSSDITLRSDLEYVCNGPIFFSTCELLGRGIELPGVGGAHVSGRVAPDGFDRPISNFTLQGADQLTVYADPTCAGWSISGTDRGTSCPGL